MGAQTNAQKVKKGEVLWRQEDRRKLNSSCLERSAREKKKKKKKKTACPGKTVQKIQNASAQMRLLKGKKLLAEWSNEG